MGPSESPRAEARVWIARAFTAVEDVVYIGLGLLLATSALTLLVTGSIQYAQSVAAGKASNIELLDRILLILLIVEMLYTVQVSFREHALLPEPFLLVGLISAIRRVLVLTAEFGEWREKTEIGGQHFVIELAVLTVLILALVISLVLLRKRGAPVVAKRA
jgi:phosphate starvation-inducible membrane PsiE